MDKKDLDSTVSDSEENRMSSPSVLESTSKPEASKRTEDPRQAGTIQFADSAKSSGAAGKGRRIGTELAKEESEAIAEAQRLAAELNRKASLQTSSAKPKSASSASRSGDSFTKRPDRPEGRPSSGGRTSASSAGGKYRGYRQRYRRPPLDERNLEIDFLHPEVLQRFMSKTGKILPARVTGARTVIQRKIAKEIKRARHIGFLPYTHR